MTITQLKHLIIFYFYNLLLIFSNCKDFYFSRTFFVDHCIFLIFCVVWILDLYTFFPLSFEVVAKRIFLVLTQIIWIKGKFCFLNSQRDLELRIQTINEASSTLWCSTSLSSLSHTPEWHSSPPLQKRKKSLPWVHNLYIQSPFRLVVLRDMTVLRASGRKPWLVTRLEKPSSILFTRMDANSPNVLSAHVLFWVILLAQHRLNTQPRYFRCCKETHLHSTDSVGCKRKPSAVI